MLEPSRALLFAAAAAVLVATPGPNSLYIVTRGIGQGRRAAVVSALGIETADLLHVAAAALGVSALVASSAVTFATLRYLGAAYLVYLGVRALRAGSDMQTPASESRTSLGHIYWQGFVVNALNPKAVLFFLAFLPQFVEPARGSVPQQVLLLGLIFILVGITFDMLYAVLSGALGARLRQRPTFVRRQRYLSCAVYVGLGVSALAVSGTHPSA